MANRERVGVLKVTIEYKILRNNDEMSFELVDRGKIGLAGHGMDSLIGQVKDALKEADMLEAASVVVEMDDGRILHKSSDTR